MFVPFQIQKSLVTGVLALIHLVLVMSMNTAVLIRLWMVRRELAKYDAYREDSRDSEVKLSLLNIVIFLYSVVQIFIQVGSTVRSLEHKEVAHTHLQVIFYVNSAQLTSLTVDILFSIQSVALDLHVVTAPLFLLLMSAAARQELKASFGSPSGRAADNRVFSLSGTSSNVAANSVSPRQIRIS